VHADASEDRPVAPQRLSVRVGLAFVQTLRPLLYALLAASAALTFLAGTDVRGHRLPQGLLDLAPWLFAAFLVVFAVYRLKLVAARRYPALSAFFQIGLGALVFVLLLPSQRKAASEGRDDVGAMLASSDSRVRAVAAEVAGYRAGGERYAPGLIELLSDGDAQVRAAARSSLVRVLGRDPAQGQPDEAAAEAFRAEAKRRGLWRQ
jgi:hypothetical protein